MDGNEERKLLVLLNNIVKDIDILEGNINQLYSKAEYYFEDCDPDKATEVKGDSQEINNLEKYLNFISGRIGSCSDCLRHVAKKML